MANLDTNICKIPNLQAECKYFHLACDKPLIHSVRIVQQLGLQVNIVFDPTNQYMLTINEAVDQPLMLMYNQYADRAVLSLRSLHDLLGVYVAYTHSHDDLAQAMSNDSHEEHGLVDLDPLWL